VRLILDVLRENSFYEKLLTVRNVSSEKTLCWKTVPAERCVVTIFELTFVADDKLFVHRALLSS